MIRDTHKGFGLISIVLHWFVAAMIIALWFDGQALEDAATPEGRAQHFAWGTVAGLFILARVLWRLSSGNPDPLSTSPLLNSIAKYVKLALLADMVVIIVAGVLSVWLMGRNIDVLGVFSLPSPFAANHDLHEVFQKAHSLTANLMVPLIGLHVLGALKHLVLDRDGTFSRMIWPARQA
jgi:cytochrome b561